MSITVSHENCENIEEIFKYLTITRKINSIKCTRDYGVSALIPEFGGLCSTVFTRTLNPPLPARVMIHPINNGEVIFSEELNIPAIPYEPFYGTIGTAPELEAISSLSPGFHGGNMDAADVCPGNKIFFPIDSRSRLRCIPRMFKRSVSSLFGQLDASTPNSDPIYFTSTPLSLRAVRIV